LVISQNYIYLPVIINRKNQMSPFYIRATSEKDQDWVERFLEKEWHSKELVSRGTIYHAGKLPGFIAEQNGKPIGLATYHIEKAECEIITLNSLREGLGVGSALIDAVKTVARDLNCHRLWLITTNDNLSAIEFYKKRGYALAAIHKNAIEASRKLKPQIPLIGKNGIPIKDEIEFEILL
jgi:GNAT superfamily N-acetyltransferase